MLRTLIVVLLLSTSNMALALGCPEPKFRTGDTVRVDKERNKIGLIVAVGPIRYTPTPVVKYSAALRTNFTEHPVVVPNIDESRIQKVY